MTVFDVLFTFPVRAAIDFLIKTIKLKSEVSPAAAEIKKRVKIDRLIKSKLMELI